MKFFLALILIPSSLWAQRNLTQIPSTNPTDQMASFNVAEGFEISLFASEPMVHKPIQMAWDARGRLWVASSAIYPQIRPGQTQNDQILVLEDTDEDGKADKRTVFYEGLFIPTGIWPQDGGAYVANSTELWFIHDRDQDGKGESHEVLLSGFGTEDTHHILHGIKGGPDGNLYFNQSVYIHSHIETPFGVRRLMGSGIWQFQPQTGRLEVFTLGQINPWGHVFDNWGQSFTTDGAYGEGINYAFPGATYRCLPDQLPRILKGMNPGQPKQCGLEVISGRHFPNEWQGNMITCDFRGHRVNRFSLGDEKSGYRSQQLADLVSSSHGSFRPVDVNMGPDGALYLADWYNPIIQHGEVDFRDPRRDQLHGRIWRITAKNRPLSPRVNFAKLSVDDLFKQLLAPEQSTRYWAKQEIKSRKLLDLKEAIVTLLKTDALSDSLRCEYLWAAQTAGIEDFVWFRSQFWDRAQTAVDGKLRAAIVRTFHQLIRNHGTMVMGINDTSRDAFFLTLCRDPHPRVRLEAVNLLRTVATPRAIEIATTVLAQEMDENLDFALWRSCYEQSSTWLPAFQAGQISFTENSQGLLFALKAANQSNAAALLLDVVEKNQLAPEQLAELMKIIGSTIDQANLNRLFTLALDAKYSPTLRAQALQAMITAQQQRSLIPEQTQRLLPLLDDSATANAAIELAGLWKIEAARAKLESLASSSTSSSDISLLSIARLGGPAAEAFLNHHLKPSLSQEKQASTLQAMILLDSAKAAPLTVDFLSKIQAESSASGSLIQAFLSLKEGPALLTNALTGKKLQLAIASQALQKASASGGDTKDLINAITVAGGLTPITSLTEAEMRTWIEEINKSGNAARGETIYRRLELQCIACHAIGPVGGIVGPNLVSIGSSAPMDYIIDSLLEPAKKIKEGYATAMITTKDGATHTGFLAREDERDIVLRDNAGKMQTIPAAQVSKKEVIPVSLMPAGLTHSLRRDELADLVKFLTELGKDGAYKVQEDGTVRHWQSFQNETQSLALTAWVDGSIELKEVPVIQLLGKPKRKLESAFEMPKDGTVTLAIDAADNARIELNGQELFLQEGKISQPLKAGRHTLRLLIPEPSNARPRVRLLDATAKPIHE
jgi:putative heme-binding domain-containing protein